MAPKAIAQILINNMSLEGTYVERVSCANPGFINFYINNSWVYDNINCIQSEKDDYGKINISEGQAVIVEFVSANPTGPLHMGNARGGALGELISGVLEYAGYLVTREFYINDAGNQIEKFGISLEARYLQILQGQDKVQFPEDGYHGEDIIDHAKEYINQFGDNLLSFDSEERRKILIDYALPKNINKIKNSLTNYGINYDVWFSEKSLYDTNQIWETIDYLKANGYTYEKEGALWFKVPDCQDEKDNVLVRSNGIPTYFATDIAYHRNKFIKRKFHRVINLWGADHHGHVARMKNAVAAFSINSDNLDVILFQLVHLFKNGEKVKMSKRTGHVISLDDLLKEVGKDAARFFFNMKASGNHLDFDMDLAIKQSNENPVFYVQYAHARICSMLKLLESEGINVHQITKYNLDVLNTPEEINLLKRLARFPEEIEISAKTLEPSRITRYVLDLASDFHSFYNSCRVKGSEEDLMNARILLVDSTKIVIQNVLRLLAIEAKETM